MAPFTGAIYSCCFAIFQPVLYLCPCPALNPCFILEIKQELVMWNVTKGFLEIQIYYVICCALSNPVNTPLCKFFSPKMQQTKTLRKLLKTQLIALYLQTTDYIGHTLCQKVTLQTLHSAFILTNPLIVVMTVIVI